MRSALADLILGYQRLPGMQRLSQTESPPPKVTGQLLWGLLSAQITFHNHAEPSCEGQGIGQQFGQLIRAAAACTG
jgi:hypothetical protein